MTVEQLTKQYREDRDNTRRENLKLLVARYGSARALAIAVSKAPQQIGQLLRGESPIGDRITADIEKKLNLAEGTLDKKPDDVVPIAVAPEPQQSPKLNFTRVPLVSSVQAGLPRDCGDLCFDEFVDVPGELPDGCYALKVSGDSMSPLMDEGDVVVVDPDRWPKPGDCIVARSELENLSSATVKRYYPIGFDETGREVFEARPFNSEYPVMHSVDQKLSVVGTVCKLIKDM